MKQGTLGLPKRDERTFDPRKTEIPNSSVGRRVFAVADDQQAVALAQKLLVASPGSLICLSNKEFNLLKNSIVVI